jgi:hypothetical protein
MDIPQPPKANTKSSLSNAAIVAIACTVAFVALLLAAVALAMVILRRKQKALAIRKGTSTPPQSSKPSDRLASEMHLTPGLNLSSAKSSDMTSLRTSGFNSAMPPGSSGFELPPKRSNSRYQPLTTVSGTISCYTMGSTNTEATMAGATWHQQLNRALNNMRIARPSQPFAGRYLLLQERASGGQAVIAFARDRDGGFFQYAIKFFRRLEDFEVESEFYCNPRIRKALPQVFHGGDNADKALRSPGGFVFPPFLVLERGAPLPMWMQEPRSFPSVLNMFHDLAMQLERLHSADYVHCDFKPDNVLLMLQTQVWKLIDLGISKCIGELFQLQSPFVTRSSFCNALCKDCPWKVHGRSAATFELWLFTVNTGFVTFVKLWFPKS